MCVNDVAIRGIKRARASRYLHECRDANGDELRMVASTRGDGNVADVFVRVVILETFPE